MWVITHIPTGHNIAGFKRSGFYSYKEAHKFILCMNRMLVRGMYLYYNDFTYAHLSGYLPIIYKLTKAKNAYKAARIVKLAEPFDLMYVENSSFFKLKGRSFVYLLCIKTKIYSKDEVLKPINKSEFLIHYVN